MYSFSDVYTGFQNFILETGTCIPKE